MSRQADLLKGVRVIDLTRLLPGPLCTQHLADLGAEVIKVEDVQGGDYARHGLGIGSNHDIRYFNLVNRGKQSIAIDLKSEQGKRLFLDLAARAQVVVEGFRPGVVDRLGIGYDAVRELNTAIVYCSISGYGQQGPLAQQAGHDLNYCSLAGITEQSGSSGDRPAISAFQIADLAGGTLTASTAILAALYKARDQGKGSYLDVAMADSVLAHSVFNLATCLEFTSTPRRGEGLLTGGLPCYGVYETADGRYLALAALETKFWRRFCEAVDRSDLFDKQAASGPQGEAVRNDLATLFRSKSLADWLTLLEPADCCVNAVLNTSEALSNPQFRARGLFLGGEATESPVEGFAFPVQVDGTAPACETVAPNYGEQGTAILAELGLSDEEIEALSEAGVVRIPESSEEGG